MTRFRRAAFLVLGPVFLLAIGLLLFPASGRDDAHIGYWVALCLSRFGRVINYNGEAIEQSSTLLHALVLAAAHRLTGANMIVLGRLSAIFFGLGAVVLTQRIAARINRALVIPAGLLAASSAYFIYWSFGGMEATLSALLAALLILVLGDYLALPQEKLVTRQLVWIAVTIAAFLLVRPEQPLVLGCLLAAGLALTFVAPDRRTARRLSLVCGIAVFLTVALFLWRWQTFGSLFPQPVSAKSGSFSAHTVKVGFRYFARHVLARPGIAIFFFVALAGMVSTAGDLFRRKQLPPHLVLTLLFLGSYGGFVIMAGGDWMEAGRFLVPLIPGAAIFVALIWQRVAETKPRYAALLAIGLVLVQLAGIFQVARRSSTAIPFWSNITTEPYATESRATDFTSFERRNRANLRDIPTIRRLREIVAHLRAAKHDAEPVRMMSAQLGMVAYYVVGEHFGHVRLLDRRGLIDRQFTSCPLLSHLRRTAGGLQLDYEYYFAHRTELETQCHIPRPDVIFDIGEPPAFPDYTVIYTQTGAIRTDSTLFPGLNFRAAQFVAVRNDLLPALKEAR